MTADSIFKGQNQSKPQHNYFNITSNQDGVDLVDRDALEDVAIALVELERPRGRAVEPHR